MENETKAIIDKAQFIIANTGDQPDADVGPEDARALALKVLAYFGVPAE